MGLDGRGSNDIYTIPHRARIWTALSRVDSWLRQVPITRGEAKKIVPYMSDDQDFLAPIMSNPENVFQLGPMPMENQRQH